MSTTTTTTTGPDQGPPPLVMRNANSKQQNTVRPMRRDQTNYIPVPVEIVMATCEALPEEQAEIIEWSYQYFIDRPELNLTQFGKRADADGSHIKRLWENKYIGNYENLCATLRKFRENEEALNGVGQPDFVRTEIVAPIFNFAGSVMDVGEMGMLVGDYGIGKTFILEEFAQLHRREVRLFTCPKTSAHGDFLRKMAKGFGITERSANVQREKILTYLIRQRVRLLIVDELHAPFTYTQFVSKNPGPVRNIEFLREIYDETHGDTSVLACGTKALPRFINDSIWSRSLEQFQDRGDSFRDISGWIPPATDLVQFYKQYGLADRPPAEAEKLIEDILTGHSLRRLVFRLRASATLANKMDRKHTWDHFLDVHDLKADWANPKSKVINRKFQRTA